ADVEAARGKLSSVSAESKQHPVACKKNATLAWITPLLTRREPPPPPKTFLKPSPRTQEFCSTCHKVELIPALNSYRWLRGQNHYDTWYDSGVSGRAVRSFYDPPQARACRDCHLPPYRSDEFGNRRGQLHDHMFPAANTALPFIRGDGKTQEAIAKFLQDKVLTVDLFAIKRGDEIAVIGEKPPAVKPGETLDLEVVVRTRG